MSGTGITAAVSNSGTSKVKITFTTTATVNTACEATIPVVVDGMTMNKKFSFAVARTGNTGATGKGIKGDSCGRVCRIFLQHNGAYKWMVYEPFRL